MNTINIEGKEYELNFGIRFSRALSRVYTMERNIEGNTMKFGLGVRMVVGYLETADADAIFNTFKAALAKHKKMPTDTQIEDALDELATEHGGFDGLADLILDTLRDTGFYDKMFTEMETEMETAEEKKEA